jgi:hypothetical protein
MSKTMKYARTSVRRKAGKRVRRIKNTEAPIVRGLRGLWLKLIGAQ